MIYGFMPHSEMVVISLDGYGNLCATTGSGGGNASTIIDTPEYTMPNPVQVFAREPTSGKRMAIPLTANNYLYDSMNPGTIAARSNPVDVKQTQDPTPVILCGRNARWSHRRGQFGFSRQVVHRRKWMLWLNESRRRLRQREVPSRPDLWTQPERKRFEVDLDRRKRQPTADLRSHDETAITVRTRPVRGIRFA